METSLRDAIKEEQFIVYFQPQYDTRDNHISGMEALIRWKHPEFGLISPGKFIPVAEESGLIIEIDRIVMKKAMQSRKNQPIAQRYKVLSLQQAARRRHHEK